MFSRKHVVTIVIAVLWVRNENSITTKGSSIPYCVLHYGVYLTQESQWLNQFIGGNVSRYRCVWSADWSKNRVACPRSLKPVKFLQHLSMWEADDGSHGNRNVHFIWKRLCIIISQSCLILTKIKFETSLNHTVPQFCLREFVMPFPDTLLCQSHCKFLIFAASVYSTWKLG